MGWKSTKSITREEAISAIMAEMSKIYLKPDYELEGIMCEMFGDDPDKPYYGYNFSIVSKEELKEEE